MTPDASVDDVQAKPRRKRGRPPTTDAQHAERRQQIVQAAFEVFTHKGYKASGISDIAEHLNIGNGTVYRYFENKREILDHVFDYGVQEFMQGVLDFDIQSVASREDFRATLRSAGERVFARFDESPEIPRLVLLEISSIDKELTMRVLSVIEWCTGMVTPLMETGVARGWLRDSSPPHLARSLIGTIISGILSNLRTPMTRDERDGYIKTVVDLYCPPSG